MHIALTGASGFIGSVLARRLHESGHTVSALVRGTSRRDHIEPFIARFIVGEQDDHAAWPALLDGAEGVIHNSLSWEWPPLREGHHSRHLKSNLLGSLELLRASAPRPFVFMSTIAVHHDMRPRWGGLIDEDHPLRPSSDYGAYKAAVEAHLWAEHFEGGRHTAAIRPCAVYGIDPRLDRSRGHDIIEAIKKDCAYAKPGGGKFVHVEDVADATIAALTDPGAAGKPFNLVDCYARWADLAVMAAGILGIQADIDLSSPAQPQNEFDKTQAESLGVPPPFLERGHDGIRRHLEELIRLMG